MDRYAQYAMVSSDEAVNDAGFNLDTLDKDRAELFGVQELGGLETFQIEMLNFFSRRWNQNLTFLYSKMISDIAGGHISIKYGFRGPNFATVSACFPTNAIIDALITLD
jgi:3-oxoacyl-[acyl-carrier-protein] synthase II